MMKHSVLGFFCIGVLLAGFCRADADGELQLHRPKQARLGQVYFRVAVDDGRYQKLKNGATLHYQLAGGQHWLTVNDRAGTRLPFTIEAGTTQVIEAEVVKGEEYFLRFSPQSGPVSPPE